MNVAITIAKKLNSHLDIELMLSELRYHLPNYKIFIDGGDVILTALKKISYCTYPLGFMMELYRQDLIERAFILPAIVPN